MKKWIRGGLLGLLAITIVMAIILYVCIDTLVKRAIEKRATYTLGVTTTVGSAHVNWRDGELTVKNMTVANPKGFSGEYFLHLGQAEAIVSLDSLVKKTVDVAYMRLHKIDLHLEQNQEGKSNFQPIVSRLAQLSSGGPTDTKAANNVKNFLFREIRISDISVHAKIRGQVLDVKISEIPLKNIGNSKDSGPVDINQLSNTIFRAIFESLMANPQLLPTIMAHQLGEEMVRIGGLSIKKLEHLSTETHKAIQSGVEDLVKETGKTLGRTSEETSTTLKNISNGIGNILSGEKNEAPSQEDH